MGHGEFASAMIRTLGLPPLTRWFELRVHCNEIVSVTCGYLPEPNSHPLNELVGKFRVERVEDDRETA